MPAEIVWLPQAEDDILNIYVVIGLEQPKAAEAYFSRIEAKVGLLSSHPELGTRRPDIADALRMLVEAPFVVLYKTVPDSDEEAVSRVEIVRVLDGRRDLASIVR